MLVLKPHLMALSTLTRSSAISGNRRAAVRQGKGRRRPQVLRQPAVFFGGIVREGLVHEPRQALAQVLDLLGLAVQGEARVGWGLVLDGLAG